PSGRVRSWEGHMAPPVRYSRSPSSVYVLVSSGAPAWSTYSTEWTGPGRWITDGPRAAQRGPHQHGVYPPVSGHGEGQGRTAVGHAPNWRPDSAHSTSEASSVAMPRRRCASASS